MAVLPGENAGAYKLLVAQQRGWDYITPEYDDLDDDAGGLNANGEPLNSRIWIYCRHVGPRRLGTGAAAGSCVLGRPIRDHPGAG